MTDERMALLELVESEAEERAFRWKDRPPNADADLVRDMLAFAAERIMEAEVETLTGAAKGAPQRPAGDPPERLARAGVGHPCGPDRAGHPEAAQGELLPELPRAAPDGREGARGGHPRQACVHGVSTRAVDDLVKAMG